MVGLPGSSEAPGTDEREPWTGVAIPGTIKALPRSLLRSQDQSDESQEHLTPPPGAIARHTRDVRYRRILRAEAILSYGSQGS